jgi:hypothetical protein
MQLQREIGVTYKTAWRMLQLIRKAMGKEEKKEFFDTIVEIDETYVGGKPRKGSDDDDDTPKPKRGRGTNKTPVVGVVDRENKQVYAKVAMPNSKGLFQMVIFTRIQSRVFGLYSKERFTEFTTIYQ